LIEFHHRFKGASILDTYRVLKNLNDLGYKTYHISGYAEEVSLIHEDYIK